MDGTKPGDTKKDYSQLLSTVEERYEVLKDKWHKPGKEVWKIYSGDDDSIPFNILYSNTETIVPAIFSRKPIARVTRRFDESRADIPASIVQRMLTYCMDMNLPRYPSFMRAIEDSVLDAALPGQGLFRVRNVQGFAILDYVEWDKFVWGVCSRWERCQWIAFAHDLEADEVLEMFPKLTPEQKAYFEAAAKAKESQQEKDEQTGETKPPSIRVWEHWDKRSRTRKWLCDAASDCCLQVDEDPLKLNDFFPVPNPLKFLHTTTDTLPRPLYKLYQDQALELNEITRRLKNIMKAIKVRGIYASGIDDIPNVFNQDDDNTLIPSQAAANVLVQGKGLDAYIWLIPIEKLIVVAKELYMAREAIKGTIYEILGIGDILRGVSKASETLGAQEIKDKWGSLRINKLRERTAEFVRDGLRLLADCAVKNTPEDVWAKVTGVPLKSQMEAAVLAQQGQPLPPEATWAGVLKNLQDDVQRSFLIDIESNSTVDAEATEEKRDMAEFMNALGQAMSGLKELMGGSPQGWEAGKAILLGIISKFNLGEDVAPMLKALPAPQAGNPQTQKMMQDLQKKLADVAKREEGAAAEESQLKEMLSEVTRANEAIAAQKESLQQEKAQLAQAKQFAIKEIELARDQGVLAVQAAEVKLATKEATLAAREKALSKPQPNQPRKA